MTKARVAKIRSALEAAFSPKMLEIEDESHQHIGHEHAGGLGHFKVKIMADAFEDKPLIQSHKEIYAALDNLMKTDIHALSIIIQKKSS